MRQWLAQLTQRRKAAMVGIDIGARTIKAAEVIFGREQPVLRQLASVELPEGAVDAGVIQDVQAIAEALERLYQTSGILTKDIVAAVHGRAAYMREIVFPAMNNAELQEAVRWDMEKYVPFAPGSYYHDFHASTLEHDEKQVKVFLVAALKEQVNLLLQACQTAGVRIAAIDVEALALQRLLGVNAEHNVIVDVGGQSSQLIIYRQATPVANRAIPIGGQHFSQIIMREMGLEYGEAERLKQRQRGLLAGAKNEESTPLQTALGNVVVELGGEIRRTLEYYQMQNKQAVFKTIYVTGGSSGMDNLLAQLYRHVGTPLEALDPWTVVENQTSLEAEHLRQVLPRYSVAIGLALRGGAE